MIPKDFSQYDENCRDFLDKWLLISMSHTLAMEMAEEYNGEVEDSVMVRIRSLYSDKPLIILINGAERSSKVSVILDNRLMSKVTCDMLHLLIAAFRTRGEIPPELRFI